MATFMSLFNHESLQGLAKQALIESLSAVYGERNETEENDKKEFQQDLTLCVDYLVDTVTFSQSLKNNKGVLFRYNEQNKQIESLTLGRQLYELLLRTTDVWFPAKSNKAQYLLTPRSALKRHPYASVWFEQGRELFLPLLERYIGTQTSIQQLGSFALDDLKERQPDKLCGLLNAWATTLTKQLLGLEKEARYHLDSVRQNYRRLTAYTQKLVRYYKTLDVMSFMLIPPVKSSVFHTEKEIRDALNKLLSAIKKENSHFLGYAWKLKYFLARSHTGCYVEVLVFFTENSKLTAAEQEIEKKTILYSAFLDDYPLYQWQHFTLTKQAPTQTKQLFEQLQVSLTLTDLYWYFKPIEPADSTKPNKAKTFAKTTYKPKPRKKKEENVSTYYFENRREKK